MSVTAKALINAKYASGSATIEYTAPVSTRTIIDKFTATNTDVGSVNLTVHIVASGGAADASNAVISAKPLTAGTAYDLTELKNHILSTGDTIQVVASVASKVVIRASGREVT